MRRRVLIVPGVRRALGLYRRIHPSRARVYARPNIASSRWIIIAALLAATACDDAATMPTSPSAHPLTGVVLDHLGDPVNGARVEIVDGVLAGRFTLTTSAGQFSIRLDGVSPQTITLRISRDGFSPVTWPVSDPSALVIVLQSSVVYALDGDYTMTVTAAATCEGIPASLRSRTYVAKLRRARGYNALFTVELEGAEFHPGYGTLFGNYGENGAKFWVSSWDAFNWWLEAQPIFERLASSGYVSLVGSATARTADANASMVAAFEGSFGYCARFQPSSTPQWPPVCTDAKIECRSASHQLTLDRR